MKALVTALLVLLTPAAARAGGPFGAGVMFGEPTGVSLKLHLGGRSAVDAGLGWAFGSGGAIAMHADYLVHVQLAEERGVRLFFYAGAGPRLRVRSGDHDESFSLALRIPLGLVVPFEKQSIDLFLEIVPGLQLYPATDGIIDAAIGIRYYF